MMFDASKYGNDPERILEAVESGEVALDVALGMEPCFVCKQVFPALEMNVCTQCGEGFCGICPPFCQCVVNENLGTLSTV